MMKLFVRFLVVAFVSLSSLSAQTILTPSRDQPGYSGSNAMEPVGRPKIGIVLSGGGARALAQIGVLRVLERHNIPVDLIVGNSLGSVVGGLYAAGYTTTAIESIATHVDWNELLSFAEDTKRTDLFYGQRQQQAEGFLLIRFEGLQPIIPSSISGGQRISNFFSSLSLQALYHPDPSFDNLKIPFRAISTDLLTGRRVILDRGSLAEAMRASVTVPLLYSPLERDSMYLVDGGLMTNIPADVARSLGCDVVIVVNSTSSMRTAQQMNAPWEIADQIMTIMMQESNGHELSLADVVITPEGRNRIVSDFSDIGLLIAAGERAAEGRIEKIREAILRPRPDHADSAGEPLRAASVSFQGDSISPTLRDDILQEARRGELSLRHAQAYLDRLAGTGLYARLWVDVPPNGAAAPALVFHAIMNQPLRKVAFRGEQPDLVGGEDLERTLSTHYGRVMGRENCRELIEDILALYRAKGYSLARIDSVAMDQPEGLLSVWLSQGRIAQIRYEGNERTRDYVIRREFPIDEGEIFNIQKASQGVVNIKSTGLFEYVLLDVRYNNKQPVIVIRVKEKSSELLRLGFHADDEHGILSAMDIRDANFRGAWEDLGLALRYGYRDRAVRAEYTVNRIFNTYLTLNLKIYAKSRDIFTYLDDPAPGADQWDIVEGGRYRESRYGWSMSFGSHYERLGDISAELRWENQKITPISGEEVLPEQYRFVSLKLQSVFDNEDRFSFPTKGMNLTLSYESAMKGLESEVGFGKINAMYENYLTVLPGHTLRTRLSFGFADQTLPVAEQYSLGGFSNFLGLREDEHRGRQLFLVNAEYRFSLPFKLIFDTYAMIRYDLGTISLIPEELKLHNFRHGIGAEIALDTPLGPASFGMGRSFYFQQDVPNTPLTLGPLLLYFSVGPTF